MRTGVPFAERGGALRGLLDLATGRYPAFLFGGSLRGVLPVFHFHQVTREWLEPRLRYLAENGYRTVTSDEIARLVVSGVDPGPRAVALTFDDAWASVWTVAVPLLREYKLTAILFAIPARVVEAETVRPSGGAIGTTAHESGPLFVTWPELRALHTSGIVDVQSHTRSHAMIFSDDALAGFVTPDYAREPLLERPLASANGALHFVEPDALGTPLYLRRSRMSDARRFVADERVGDRCRDHVRRHDGPEFFRRATWRRELREIAATGTGAFETGSAQAAAIRAELALGRELLNERLGTSSVRHVALPWGIAGHLTRRALAETGHETAFAERPFRRRGVREGDDRFQLMRINGKFLTCLPGRGRQWFFTTV
jgi:peptidoglycan/xylan/chitin deacetylase (PgdA/CDA1 family)